MPAISARGRPANAASSVAASSDRRSPRPKRASLASSTPRAASRAVDQLGELACESPLGRSRVRLRDDGCLQRLDLLVRPEAEAAQVLADHGVVDVEEVLVERERRRHRRIQPQRVSLAGAELLAVGGGQQRRGQRMHRCALHPANEVDAGRQVAPLVRAAGLQHASVSAMKLQVVQALEHLVAELGVADPACLEAGAHRLLGEHPVHAEVLADVAQEVDRRQRLGPIEVVRQHGRVVTLEADEPLDLPTDALHPAGDHIALVQHAFRAAAARVADEPGRATHQADRPVACQLEPSHRDELHEVAELEARRGGIEAAVARGSGRPPSRRAARRDRCSARSSAARRGRRARRCGCRRSPSAAEYTHRTSVLPCRPMTRRPPPPGWRGPPGRGAPGRRRPGSTALPRIVLAVFGALAVGLFVGLMGVYASYTNGLPDVADIENFDLAQGSTVVSGDGTELATFAIEDRREISFAEIPQLMIDAQVAAEDQTFWTEPVHRLPQHRPRAAAERPGRRDRLGRVHDLPAARCGCASSTRRSWPTPSARWSARSRRRSSPSGSTSDIRGPRARSASSRCT